MPRLLTILVIFNGMIFIVYGALCLLAGHMKDEIDRYHLSQFRILVGWLELLGGLGVISGLLFSKFSISIFSATGLSLLMALGVITRIRIGDTFIKIIPALCLGLLNAWISFRLFQHYS